MKQQNNFLQDASRVEASPVGESLTDSKIAQILFDYGLDNIEMIEAYFEDAGFVDCRELILEKLRGI